MPKRALHTTTLVALAIVFASCDRGESPECEQCVDYTEESVIDYLNGLPPDAKERIFSATGGSQSEETPEPAAPTATPQSPTPPAVPEPSVADPEPTPVAPAATAEPIPAVGSGDMTTPVSTITGSCEVGLNRLLLTRAIGNREPVGTEPPFAATAEPIYVYMDLANPNGPANQVNISWRHPTSNHVHQQTMDVGVSPNWRTWVRHGMGASRTGRWEISLEVDGCVIGTIELDAVAAP